MIEWLTKRFGVFLLGATLALVAIAIGTGLYVRGQDIQRIDALEDAQQSLTFATLEVQLAQKKLDAANTRLRKAAQLSTKQQGRLRKRLKRDAQAIKRLINQLVKSGQISPEEGARLRRGVSVSLPDSVTPPSGSDGSRGGKQRRSKPTPTPDPAPDPAPVPAPDSPGNSSVCIPGVRPVLPSVCVK